MRALDQNEVLAVSGGTDLENSNFSFFVENTALGAFIGLPLAAMFSEPNVIVLSAIVFGGIATAMILFHGLDAYCMQEPETIN